MLGETRLAAEKARGQQREGLHVKCSREKRLLQRCAPKPYWVSRRTRDNLPKTERKGEENKLKRTHEKEKKGTQPFVFPRLRNRSGIETLIWSPRGQPDKDPYPKIPTLRQKQTDKFKEINEMYFRQNAQFFEYQNYRYNHWRPRWRIATTSGLRVTCKVPPPQASNTEPSME